MFKLDSNSIKRFLLDNWQFLIALAVYTCFAVVFNLNRGDLWFDEKFTRAALSQENLDFYDQNVFDAEDTPIKHLLYDVHPFLYYGLLRVWALFFGDSAFALRFASTVFFLPGLYFAFRIVKLFKLSAPDILIVLLFIAVNPLLVAYGAEARMYSLLATALIGAAYFFLRNFSEEDEQKQRRNSLWFQILLGISFHIQYIAFFFALTLWLIMNLRRKYLTGGVKNFFTENFQQFWIAGIFALPAVALALFQVANDVWIGWIENASFELFPRTFYIFLFGANPGTEGGLDAVNLLGWDSDQMRFVYSFTFAMLAIVALLIMLSLGKEEKKLYSLALISTLPIVITTTLSIVITTVIPWLYDLIGKELNEQNDSLSFYIERYYLTSVLTLMVYLGVGGLKYSETKETTKKREHSKTLVYAVFTLYIMVASYINLTGLNS